MCGVFKKCHAAVDPVNYYEACVFDSCFVPERKMECASLQIYASTCADQGVCIDWRSHTSGSCPIQCPSNKVYKACARSLEETCKSGVIGHNQTQLREGCFCPDGTTLYDDGCVGPDNVPRKFGEKFEFDCKDCICLEGGSGIICEPHKCPATAIEEPCEGEGFYKITEVNPEDKCCSSTVCVCNATDCTAKPPHCEPGFEAIAETPASQCCPVYKCIQRPAITTSECSTWGNFHFQTFDHVKYNFPGLCRYIFVSHCKDDYQDFNIEIMRSIKNGTVIYFTAMIDGVLLEVKESSITVDGKA
ncbi:hypothetical protein JD844_021948 [Phrynosoma platyrhinos]|uniref:VWFD domain-containing protein n=1 Tax=Phrynosoma platyrhinos TaxID=52577 RepID=A0ABQ7SUH9_PHRPL|nr:hypothetical protein JD844_021948 [Phrynosoma platyrhinos]